MSIDNDRELRHDAWIDEVLKADAREHADDYILDDGFTARVVAELPPAIAPTPRWRRPAVVALWGAAAAGAAIALPDLALGVGREAFRLLAAQPISLPQIGAALVAIGIATWSAAVYALRND
jgi:hypothetical protein